MLKNEKIIFSLKFLTLDFRVYGKETSQEFTKIYSQRKSEDSSGGFGFEKTRRINQSTLSKNFKPICE